MTQQPIQVNVLVPFFNELIDDEEHTLMMPFHSTIGDLENRLMIIRNDMFIQGWHFYTGPLQGTPLNPGTQIGDLNCFLHHHFVLAPRWSGYLRRYIDLIAIPIEEEEPDDTDSSTVAPDSDYSETSFD